ncbi:MAG: addiction module protein, partial [bacterium]|nr:addiction module protein [bacterium]
RAIVADSILRSLNSPESDIDEKWVAVAQKRLAELRSGQVKPIPGEQVFARIRKRFESFHPEGGKQNDSPMADSIRKR